jgi:cytochrome o ubiquinol oxidase subunit II
MGLPSKKSKRFRKVSLVLLALAVTIGLAVFFAGSDIPVLEPKGTIAEQQRDLIVFATLLSLVVILPVFVLTFYIVWKYRASNKKAKYSPDWDRNKKLELTWWGIPCVIILVLAVVAWKTSHSLDPFKPIESDKRPMTIQVIALQWKWLFIYPEQRIATVNYVQFPEDTPIRFAITADAPMNSFWIPSLGGQVYAMAGMKTELHLMADRPGEYNGSSANISGEGFAGMKFKAVSRTEDGFTQWVQSVKQKSPTVLTIDEYNKLAAPSKNNKVAYYASDGGLHDTVIMKYMRPSPEGKAGGLTHEEDTGH